MSNVINLSCSHHAMLLYNDYSKRELASINYINQGLREKQLCIYASVDAYNTSHLSKISRQINDYEENIIKRNLIILNLKPFYDSALVGDLTPFDEFYVQLQQELKLNRNNGVLIVADCADNLFRDKHFDQCNIVEKWWQDVYIKWLQQHQNHVFNVVCPHSGSLLSRRPFDQRKHQLSHNHSVIIDIEGNTINTAITDEQSEESNRQLNATVIDLRESINHLQKVNKELNTKYNNQREFVSLAAHELRSPILPILGTLELIEYEFESGKKEIKLQREHFERIMRNTKRLERLASEILDVTKIDDHSLRLTKEYFNLKETVSDLLQDYKRQLEKSNASTKLLYEFKIEEQKEIPTRQEDFSADIFINADKNRIIQVLDNLLTNAIKFTKDGIVSISITWKRDENHTDTIIVRVKDTGTGIHPEILPRLFLKFASRSEIGTGLGLFISKNIVEAHGGKIWGENNTSGKGATFVFCLPSVLD